VVKVQACAVVLALLLTQSGVDRYARVLVGDDGRIIVVTEDGRRIIPPADKEQRGIAGAAISPDRESVAWLALYSKCCTPEPRPMRLLILSGGKLRMVKGQFGEPIVHWQFQDGGRHVAFSEETPHGKRGVHYELWDARTGRRLADYKPAYDESGRVTARPNEPDWVRVLDSSK
jgi:hypothetical protein